MIKEVLIKDKSMTVEELYDLIKIADTYQVDNICLPSYFLKYAQGLDTAAQIDFPYGLSSEKSRMFEIIYACNLSKTIDVTINPFLVKNRMFETVRDELLSIFQLCKDKRVDLRVIIEHRLMSEDLIELSRLIDICGIKTVIISTGTMVDDPYDALLNSSIIMNNSSLQCIVHGIRTKEIYNIAQKEGIYGIRSSSRRFFEEIFGVIV